MYFVNFIILLALGALNASRYWGHFRFPTLFAEEGDVFLSSLLRGSPTMINAGYLNLFAATTIKVLSYFSIAYLPVISSAIAVTLSSMSLGYLLLPHWEKLLAFHYRLFIVLFFLGFSPFHEGIALVLYSFWWFAIGGTLLVVEQLYLPEDAKRHWWLKVAYILVGSLSGPAVHNTALPVLVAFFFLRWKREGVVAAIGRALDVSRKPLILCLLVTGIIQTYYFRHHGDTFPASAAAKWAQFPQATLYQVNMRILAPTLFSIPGTEWLNQSEIFTVVAMLVLLFVFAQFAFQKRTGDGRDELGWVFLLAGIGATWILYLGRPPVFDFYRFKPWTLNLNCMRYSFLPGFFLLTSLVLAFANLRTYRAQMLYRLLLVPLVLVSGILNFKSTEPVQDVQWFETARQIEEFRKGQREAISRWIVPAGWGIHVKRQDRS